MIFSLDVRRAKKGDCLLLHCGSRTTPGLVMIDGGPRDVYKPQLRPRLLAIRKARGLPEKEPLLVDLLMVSHVDDDHIQGILDLTRELIVAQDKQAPQLLRVLSLWHNSFDEIIDRSPQELASVTAGFGAAATSGELPAGMTLDIPDEVDKDVLVDSLKILASIEQGHRLRGDAERLGFPLNPEFEDQRLILASATELEVVEGLSFVVAGPMKPELQKLQRDYEEWLKKQKNKRKSTPETLAAYVDKSVPNLSSIVVLAKSDDKTILLTGDARGDKILKGLESVGALGQGATIHVDVLKVPHHGSSNNLDDDFFQRITADHYVFSGDGEHGNPERESLEMLFKARGKAPFTVHLTYPVEEIDPAREDDWNKEREKEKTRLAEGKTTKAPRSEWSPGKQSLAAFFKKTKLARGQAIVNVEPDKAHVIDLLDPLGF